jgi:aminoglycoside phosphotransferase family enzyme
MDELLRYEMTVGVNVGIGATDPIRKIERLLLGIRTMGEINPDIVSLINQEEVTKEVFGALGYKDSKRFIATQPQAKLEEMAAQLEELGGAVQQLMEQGSNKELDVQGKIVSAQIKGQSDVAAAEAKALGEMRTAQLQVAAMNERDAVKAQLHMIDSRIKAEKNDIARGELLLQKESLVHKMLMDQPDIGIDPEGKKMSEVLMNDEYGKIQGAEG